MRDESIAQEGPLPIQYSADEVGRTFRELLAIFDFTEEMQTLGVGSWRVFKRRKARRYLIGICISLWHLALERSFPNDAQAFAQHFAETYPLLSSRRKSGQALRELVKTYDDLLAEKKDGDFTTVADHIAEALGSVGDNRRRHQLKLSLLIRARYESIFDNLIYVRQA